MTSVAAVGSQILADDMRDTVRKSFTSPATGRWQIILVEDAERLNEKSANAVLKAVEEPAPVPSGCCARRPSRTSCRRSAPAAAT